MNQQTFEKLSELEQCALLLSQTFKNPNENQRKECEQMLLMLEKDLKKFLEILAAIMVSPESPIISKEVKDAAGSYLNRIIKKQTEAEDEVPQQMQLFQVELFFSAIIKENMKLSHRVQLGTCLSNLLISTNSNKLKEQLLAPTLKAIELPNNGMLGGLLTLQCITNTIQKGMDLQKLFNESIKTLIASGDNLLNLIIQALSEFSLMTNLSEQQKDQAINMILSSLESLRVWTETLKNFTIKLGDAKGSLLYTVTKQANLLVIFFKILCLQVSTELQIKDCIISTCGFSKLDDVINEVKIKVLKAINILTKFVFEVDVGGDNTNAAFFEILTKILPILLSTMLKFCKTDKIDISAQLGNPSVECVVTEILSFLTQMCQETKYYALFAEIKKMIIVEVIFPLLRTIDSEREIMNENPEEFVHLALDCCDKQLSETFKTQAAQFMERLCDHIDGTLTFVAVIAFNILDFSFASNTISDIDEKYKLLSEYKDSVIIARTSAETRVETCLLVLSVLSYTLPKRSDLLMLLETTIQAYNKFFFTTNDILIKSRYCLLISYYIENIFTDAKGKEAYAMQIRYLIECVGLKSPDYDIVAIQACDGLKALFEEEELVPRISPFISDIVEKFASYVSYVHHNSFFEILQEIVKLYAKQIAPIDGLIVLVVKHLQQKIYTELNSEKATKERMIMSNCWNTIKTICEQKEYINYRDQIEKELLPLFNYMEKPNDIDFDDEVIGIMTSFIELSGVITPVQWILLKTFPLVFEKYNSTLSSVFRCLNLMIVHGREYIMKEAWIIDLLINMAKQAVFCNDIAANEANHSEGALLLHLVMQYFGDALTNAQFETIIMIAYEKLQNGCKKNFLKARLFEIFLHGFMIRYALIEQILTQKQIIALVFDSLLNSIDCFISHYDRKVFVVGASSILLQQNMSSFVANKLPMIFNSIVTVLRIEKAVEQAEQLRKKKKTKPQDEDAAPEEEVPSNETIITSYLKDFKTADENANLLGMSKGSDTNNQGAGHNADMDDDDDYESDDDDDEYGYVTATEEEEAQGIIDNLITEFKKKDEYEFFRQVVYKIKEANLQGLQQIVDCLPEAKKVYLRLVLQSHRVATGAGTETVARKIVSVKSKKSVNDQKQITLPNNTPGTL